MKTNSLFNQSLIALVALSFLTACGQEGSQAGSMMLSSQRDFSETSNQADQPTNSSQQNPDGANITAPVSQQDLFKALVNVQSATISETASTASLEMPEISPTAITAPTTVTGYYSTAVIAPSETQIANRIVAARAKFLSQIEKNAATLYNLPASQKEAAKSEIGSSLQNLRNLNATFLSANDQMLLQTHIAVLSSLHKSLEFGRP